VSTTIDARSGQGNPPRCIRGDEPVGAERDDRRQRVAVGRGDAEIHRIGGQRRGAGDGRRFVRVDDQHVDGIEQVVGKGPGRRGVEARRAPRARRPAARHA
jgi:hypothetical protein